MSTTPFFSIIIPTYNRANILPRAIQSVLDQEFTDWELIIVDDGSVDDTKQVVVSFSDKRIRYYWQENRGRSTARNNGSAQAKGKYLCYLDDDDYYLNNHLHSFFTSINTQKSKHVIRTEGFQVNENGDKIQSPLLFKASNPILDIFYNGSGLCFYAFPREVLAKLSFNSNLNIGEDTYFILKVLLLYPLAFTKQNTHIFHYHPAPNKPKYCEQHIDRFKSLFWIIKDLEIYHKKEFQEKTNHENAFSKKHSILVKKGIKTAIQSKCLHLFFLILYQFFFSSSNHSLHSDDSK